MNSKHPADVKPSGDGQPEAGQTADNSRDEGKTQQDGLRETVESIAVAFILAFLFRAFEAEAFVIPTGSMAPTLYGRHKDVTCHECGFQYAIGASDEVDENYLKTNKRIQTSFCPNCRFQNDVYTDPVFKGDRILVTKFPYEIGTPDRWDVAVFKYPEGPTTNYIKRLVGLPGETIHIERGNLYLEDAGKRSILRKDDPGKQRVLQIPVYDNNHSNSRLHEHGWPKRWAAVEKADSEGAIAGWSESDQGWTEQESSHAFTLAGDDQFRWLRYRHFLPQNQDWERVEQADGEAYQFRTPRPQLITDVCSYNDYTGGESGGPDDAFWVGDLSLSCRLRISDLQETPQLILELNEGVRRYRCTIDLKTGEAILSHNVEISADDEEVELAKAATSLKGAGDYKVYFCNVDDRLCLWVNNRLVDFGPNASYAVPQTADQNPTDADLIPVGIAARGMNMTASDLLIERDIYYRGEDTPGIYSYRDFRDRLSQLLHDPASWGRTYSDDANLDQTHFVIGEDEFFALGDNSPRSKDSRLWSQTHTVPRTALVGKAFFIYWPHGVPFLNNGRGYPDDEGKPAGEHSLLRRIPGVSGPLLYHKTLEFDHINERPVAKATDYPKFRIPFYPHVSRMRRIR